MEIVKMKLSELNPAEYNPRKALKPGDPAARRCKYTKTSPTSLCTLWLEITCY